MSIRHQFPGFAAVFASAAMAVAGAVGGASAQEVTLRMHQFLPPQAHVPKNTLIPWAERIQEASGGRIEIQHIPSMQLGGKPPEVIDSVVGYRLDGFATATLAAGGTLDILIPPSAICSPSRFMSVCTPTPPTRGSLSPWVNAGGPSSMSGQ